MTISEHLVEINNALDELTGMQDRILDHFDPKRQDHISLLKEISILKEEFKDLDKRFSGFI